MEKSTKARTVICFSFVVSFLVMTPSRLSPHKTAILKAVEPLISVSMVQLLTLKIFVAVRGASRSRIIQLILLDLTTSPLNHHLPFLMEKSTKARTVICFNSDVSFLVMRLLRLSPHKTAILTAVGLLISVSLVQSLTLKIYVVVRGVFRSRIIQLILLVLMTSPLNHHLPFLMEKSTKARTTICFSSDVSFLAMRLSRLSPHKIAILMAVGLLILVLMVVV